MGFINNPIPSSMKSEIKKAGKILASFVDPKQAFGPDKIIPPEILANAKGLAVLTVFKLGFLGSGRFGSGVVVARLPNGSWSAPSAIGTLGAGFGGQIGFEITDFVFILNDAAAVRTFAQAGSLTFGGNVSVAAGPVGRNAEAAGVASLKSVAGIFAYNKTKGLFAGVSLEGSGMLERKDANEELYNRRVTARALLSGDIPIPPVAEPLMRVLNSRVFSGATSGDNTYNDVPIYNDVDPRVGHDYYQPSTYNDTGRTGTNNPPATFSPNRASTWQDDVYDRSPNNRGNPPDSFDSIEANMGRRSSAFAGQRDSYGSKPAPGRPVAPKPAFMTGPVGGQRGPSRAIAKFTFDSEQPGDLGFKKGDVITIIKKTDKETDWWTGSLRGQEGVFPSNYVEEL